MIHTIGNDKMMPEHEAQAKLKIAIEQFVKDVAGPTALATDYVLTIAAVDMNEPSSMTRYFESYKGNMHSLMGLNKMQHEMITDMNREEANFNADDED